MTSETNLYTGAEIEKAISLTMAAAGAVGLDVAITMTDAVSVQQQHDELAAEGRAPFMS